MSSSAAISIRTSNPRVIRPPFAQLVATHILQSRRMWRSARDSQGKNTERIPQFYKDKRHPICNQRNDETQHDTTATFKPTASSWTRAVWRSQSSFSNLSAGLEKESWNADSGHLQKHMDLLKKSIEADPYSALFGRRLNPLNKSGKYNTSRNGFLQSFTGSRTPTTTRSARVEKLQSKSDPNHVGLQYDPISGRMAPIPPLPGSTTTSEEKTINRQKTMDCPPETEVEAKFASNPSVTENGKSKLGSTEPDPVTPSRAQSLVDCPPGSELETLFSSSPIASQEVRPETQIRHTAENKPNINVDCPAGNELETLFVSKSLPSMHQPDTFKVNQTAKKLNLDAGLSTGINVACSPGSELEAKFISHPASRFVESSPPESETLRPNKQIGIPVDCPPGNELDAKLSSELASFDTKANGPSQNNITEASRAVSSKTVECFPGSEIEAQILAGSATPGVPGTEAQKPIDCPPGSELEATFICDGFSTIETISHPEMPSSIDGPPKTKIAVDCKPGNELEAKFISDSASAKGLPETEDLRLLEREGICSRYATVESNAKPRPLDFDAVEDRVGDFLQQHEKPVIANPEHQLNTPESSPKFHILAFDTTTSQISETQADSFFGIEEDARPNEVLSRLHNPAKFVPYFEKIQQNGYEIATGGGNILIFRKIQSDLCPTLPLEATADRDSSIHADIARYLRHDSLDSAKALKLPTTEPPTAGQSDFKPESARNFGSPSRKTCRRMFMAGTVTAATCYAIGVVTEFFRTGGRDGHGIDGLTAFESDRRHRE